MKRCGIGRNVCPLPMLYASATVHSTGMDRHWGSTAGRTVCEAQEQAEILLAALRAKESLDGRFLLAHAEQLLECCREIAGTRNPLN